MSAYLPRIVLAEDNSDDEFISRRAIDKLDLPCELIVKRDGAEALDYLMTNGGSVSLIMLDYNLPLRNGKEILVRLRQHETTRFTPVVIFSGGNGGSSLKECYLEGANSCVHKPDTVAEYIESLSLVVRYWLSINHTYTLQDQTLYADANAAWSAAYSRAAGASN